MKILILNWRDMKHPLSGGAEISLYEHAKYWQKQGADITWFSSSFENAKSEETMQGIHVIRRGSQYTVHLYHFLFAILHRFGNPDIVIDCFHGVPYFSPIVYPKKKIIAVIHEIAGTVWFANTTVLIATLGYLLEKLSFFFYRSVAFITVSNSTKKDLIRKKIKEENIYVIHNGLSISENSVKEKEKNPTILFLGRISHDKGIQDAFQSFRLIKERISAARLWIVGKEEKEGMIDELVREYKISDYKYFGFVSEERKIDLFSKAALLIHPSKKEGWGLTVIEAASQGTPTVGYNVEGLRDSIVQGKTGILVSTDPKSLADAVLDLLTDGVKYRTFSEQAREWSKQFDWGKSVAESWSILEKQYRNL